MPELKAAAGRHSRADHLTEARRSWNMSRISGKNTRLERAVRSLFTRHGIRYRLHKVIRIKEQDHYVRIRPDLQNRSAKWAVFANGCFWHFHRDCRDANVPRGGRTDWPAKLNATRERDARNHYLLLASGWKVLVIWECGTLYCASDQDTVIRFIREGEGLYEWPVKPPRLRRNDGRQGR